MKKLIKSLSMIFSKISKLFRNTRVMRAIRIIAITLLVLLILYLLKGVFIAAIVNGVPISRYSLIKELEKQGGKDVLNSLVTEKLIYQEAVKNKITISQADIDKEVTTIEENLKTQGMNLDTALSMQGQTRKDLETNLKIRLILEKILSDKINIADSEIQDYFNQNKTQFTGKTLETARGDILTTLRQQKLSTEYQTWITDLKNKAKIFYLINF